MLASGWASPWLRPGLGPIEFTQGFDFGSYLETLQLDPGRPYGLDYEPSYAMSYTRPASLAAGIASGVIPADVIDYATGNGGGVFATPQAWIDACNAADKFGHYDIDMSFGGTPRQYCYRGIYTSGAVAPVIEYTGRSGTNVGRDLNYCWLHTYKETPQFYGVVFKNHFLPIGAVQRFTNLTLSGVTSSRPYHASNAVLYETLNANPSGVAANYQVQHFGKITITGSVSISEITVERQIADTPAAQTGVSYFEDANWLPVVEHISLFSGATATTASQVVTAINANTGTSTYAAELTDDGHVRIKPASSTTYGFLAGEATFTGGGSVTVDAILPGVTIVGCQFIDCSIAYGFLSEVTPPGTMNWHKNDMPGTWGGFALDCLVWTDLYASGNYHYDANDTTRPTLSPGRSSNMLPGGGGNNVFNTTFYMGSNVSHLMRYQQGNDARIGNNWVRDRTSTNTTDSVNTSVAVDIRNCWLRAADNKLPLIEYNQFERLIATTGAEDCNAIYGKPRGITVIGNYIDTCGSAYTSAGLDGAECGGILFKEPGAFNGPFNGEQPEAITIRGNTLKNIMGGCMAKVDQCRADMVIDFNLFENFRGYKNGVEDADATHSGGIRVTNYVKHPTIENNRFRNVYFGPTYPQFLINLHNLESSSGVAHVGTDFSINNNELWNDGTADYPIDTGDTNHMRFQFGEDIPPSFPTFFAGVTTGYNRSLNADGSDTGFAWKIYCINNATQYDGNLAAPEEGFDTASFNETDYYIVGAGLNQVLGAARGNVVGAGV